jgi:hypothetical protein
LEKQELQRAKLEEGLKNCMDHPHPVNLPLCVLFGVPLLMHTALLQMTPRRILKLEVTRTELFSSQGSATMSKRPTWSASLAALAPLNEYNSLGPTCHFSTTADILPLRFGSSRIRFLRKRRSPTEAMHLSFMSVKRT